MSCVLSVVSVVCVVLLRVFWRGVVLDIGELLGVGRFWILGNVEGIVNLLKFRGRVGVFEIRGGWGSLNLEGVGSLCILSGCGRL